MIRLELDNTQVPVLRRAVLHELHDNSYLLVMAHGATKERLVKERKVLRGVYISLNKKEEKKNV